MTQHIFYQGSRGIGKTFLAKRFREAMFRRSQRQGFKVRLIPPDSEVKPHIFKRNGYYACGLTPLPYTQPRCRLWVDANNFVHMLNVTVRNERQGLERPKQLRIRNAPAHR